VTGKKVKPLRHSPDGGYARGDETRQRIIAAALEVFGEQGFDAATTRQIAVRAGVNPPALPYYFENKEGLYLACAASLVSGNLPAFEPLLARIHQQVASATPEACIDLFCQLMEAVLDRIFGTPYALPQHLFNARIQLGQGPEGAFRLMRDQLGEKLHHAGAVLIARISAMPAESEQTQLRTLALFGQVATFHIMRRSVFDQLGWHEVDARRLATLKQMTREHCRTLMQSWAAPV